MNNPVFNSLMPEFPHAGKPIKVLHPLGSCTHRTMNRKHLLPCGTGQVWRQGLGGSIPGGLETLKPGKIGNPRTYLEKEATL